MSDNIISFTINGTKISARPGQSVLEAARDNGISIPALCYHPDLDIKENCRLCLVEVKGKNGIFTSCSLKAEDGMEIFSDTPAVRNLVKTNLELIFGQHRVECEDCLLYGRCELLRLAKEYKVKVKKFQYRKKDAKIYNFDSSVSLDLTKCIDCKNCLDVCKKQQCGFYEFKNGSEEGFFGICPTSEKKRDCIYCGQCIAHCPVGAIEAPSEFERCEEPFLLKGKTVVVAIAPSIRVSIGELFNLPYGAIVTQQLIGAIKKIPNVRHVFDVSTGADFTTVFEADEAIERIRKNERLPMFSSCCPAWVKYAEFYRPDILEKFTAARSPQIMLGGILKTHWAKKMNLKPEDVVVVSIMPCVAKKYECLRPELKINGLNPVDYVLTTRELAFVLRKHKIDLKKVKPEPPSCPLCSPSGAGVIYGQSGGVSESALRTIYEKLTGRPLENFSFQDHPTIKRVRIAKIMAGQQEIRVCAVNTMEAAKEILDELKQNPSAYHYVEVMSCYGGCIGGGGQPLPIDEQIRKKRAAALLTEDKNLPHRAAHRNPEVETILKESFGDYAKRQSVFQTHYQKKEKENNF